MMWKEAPESNTQESTVPSTKDENIDFHGYISNLILQVYQEISIDLLT